MKKVLLTIAVSLVSLASQAQPSRGVDFITHLSGDNEVPSKETRATGQALFQITGEGHFLAYRLIVANIENVVAAHIHLAPPGANGPVVAFLFGNVAPGSGRTQGVLAEGLISAEELIGPLAGQDLSVLMQAMATGGAYINVHTNDGVAGTNSGPGDFASGELRGQIRITGK